MIAQEVSRALLLNASYEPLRVVTWQKAFLLHFQEKVEVLEAYDESIHTVSTSFKIPAVIRLRQWVKLKTQTPVVKFTRSNVYARDKYTCQYCKQSFKEMHLTLDHVLPVSKGGAKTWENIVTACLPCNQTKGGRTPLEAGVELLKTPKKPKGIPGLISLFPFRRVSPIWDPYLPTHWQKES